MTTALGIRDRAALLLGYGSAIRPSEVAALDVGDLAPSPARDPAARRHVALPMAMPRRWTAVRSAAQHGVTMHRNAVATEITEDSVRFVVDDVQHSAPASLVVYAAGTDAAAPLADELVAAGLKVQVVGDAGDVGYIEGAIHSAWRVSLAV